MADTTYYDLPYPASTDKVSLGYLNMQNLAEQIDTILNDANIPIVGDGANVLRTDTVFGGILAGTYDALTLDDDAVTTAKILNSAVTTAKILNANVTGAKIESSVALAGNPTTTTQATADDSTRIATTEFVNNVAADLVLGIVAPGTITNTMLAGGITDAKIDAAAAIAYSKLNLASSITSADIVNGTIVNADVNASAAIDKTKISGTAVTIADTGTVTSTMLLDGTILDADINAAAAIDKTKISGTAVTVADTGTVTSTMLLDGTILNADINASAAIAPSKISGTAIVANDTSYLNPVGSLIPYAGISTPTGWLLCAGQDVSRTTYATLFAAISTSFTLATTTSGSTTVSGLSGMATATHVGWGIAANGIPTGATISSVTNATTVVISAAATVTAAGSASIVISPYKFTGANNTTTFLIPDLRGRSLSGLDNMGGTAASRVTTAISGINGVILGVAGGNEAMQTHTHTQNSHSHGVDVRNVDLAAGNASIQGSHAAATWGGIGGINSTTATNQNTGAGSSQNMPPTIMINYLIKT